MLSIVNFQQQKNVQNYYYYKTQLKYCIHSNKTLFSTYVLTFRLSDDDDDDDDDDAREICSNWTNRKIQNLGFIAIFDVKTEI